MQTCMCVSGTSALNGLENEIVTDAEGSCGDNGGMEKRGKGREEEGEEGKNEGKRRETERRIERDREG